jgi:hypothetical protein
MLLVFINAYLQQKATRRYLDRDTASLKQNGKSLNDIKDNSCSKRVRSCSKLVPKPLKGIAQGPMQNHIVKRNEFPSKPNPAMLQTTAGHIANQTWPDSSRPMTKSSTLKLRQNL